ncbi:MAG: glycosyltransferase [Candidatus Bathyarchaeota archaeon]|nr:glycosyltransferase [Candidatus Bathyarchaeota archaeon]
MSKLKIAVGVCAFNEEKNIRPLLQNLTSEQELPEDCRIIVVGSGCTDRTLEIVREYSARDKRIEPIIEKTRRGKASALNKIFRIVKESADVLVLVNADALPQSGTILTLVHELMASNAGVVFAQPVPLDGPDGICYRIVRVIWRLHHLISVIRSPKLSGELCAIRTRCLLEIPESVVTDEPYIELAIRNQDYAVHYLPSAVVHIRCPTNIVDLLKQRKRIWIGHLQLKRTTGFTVSTSSFRNILTAATRLKPSEAFYAFLGVFLEVAAYSQAKMDSRNGKIPYIWEPIKSTKISI